jgi:WD40 repeat protein
MDHKDGVSSLAFSPNGQHLLSGSWDMKLKLWSLEKLRVLCTMHGHSKEIASIEISLDGRWAISACWDMTARLWDLGQSHRDYLSEYRTLSGHQGRVLACAFHPDGSRVATGSADQSILLWRVDKAIDPKVLHGHHDAVTAIRYSPSGELLLSAGRDGRVMVWDANNGAILSQLDHECPILSLAVSPDGTQAMIGDEAGHVRFLSLNYRQGPNWVAASTYMKESPIWMRGKRPTEVYEIECIFCGHTSAIKKSQLGQSWHCGGCGDTLMICAKAMFPRMAETVE